ncbi:hypothetical protein [Mycolicibacterium brumae]|uniref:hypothetical protein n=1 Tax=Mycolicibacterium brumae TaxID=85968 RepID=UPI000B2B91A5|nr:hypothetical protein [Mycolicibacterium brumae]MCV7193366.1 hypothetical protein [Mycolicibacterium brumae]RWA22231.1 hypothetical protein MBRU_13135 [Mycolicibacterium brumae DSM 44177]UWW07266.1 hypothetical protein L2Z93_000267 [Mycolicibacterium brumae]
MNTLAATLYGGFFLIAALWLVYTGEPEPGAPDDAEQPTAERAPALAGCGARH